MPRSGPSKAILADSGHLPMKAGISFCPPAEKPIASGLAPNV